MTDDWRTAWTPQPARPPAPPPQPAQPRTAPQGGTAYGRATLERLAGDLAATGEGGRNGGLNWAAYRAGQLIAGGEMDEADARTAITAAARAAGLDDAEIARTLESGITSGLLDPKKAPPRAAPRINGHAVDTATGEIAAADDPEGIWDAREDLDTLRRWAQARRASPWAVLGCALTSIACATPAWVVLPPLAGGQASLNLFIALVGPSGSGKGAAEAVAHEAIRTGHDHPRLPLGSGEGIAHAYMRRGPLRDGGLIEQHNDSALFNIAEIDSLAALHARQGSTVLAELRKAWMGEELGFAYVDKAKNLPVPRHKYRLSLVAGVQPGRAAVLLNDEDGGTPQRFIWLPSTDPTAPDIAPECPPRIEWEMPRGMVKGGLEGRYEMGVCDSARRLVDASRVGRLRDPDSDALDGHALLARLKAAAALALLDRRRDIAEDDWELSGLLMAKSDATRATCVGALSAAARRANLGKAEGEAERQIVVGERLDEAAQRRVARGLLRALRAAGAEGMGRAQLRKAIAHRDRGHFEEAVNRLIDAGQVRVTQTPHGEQIALFEEDR